MGRMAAVLAGGGLLAIGFTAGFLWGRMSATTPSARLPEEPRASVRDARDVGTRSRADASQPREPGPTVAAVSSGPSVKPVRTAQAIRDELLRLAARGRPEDRIACERLLEELIALGTEEAIGFALELMENASFDFPHRAGTFCELLMKIDDPRIPAAARRVLERNLERGLDSWYTTQGYIDLLARKGGKEGGDLLLSIIQKYPGDQVAEIAASAIGALEDRSLSGTLLNLIRENHADSIAIVESLARWRDPAILDELTHLLFQPDVPMERRDLTAAALGRNVDSSEFSGFVTRYRSASSAQERSLSLHVIAGLEHNDRLDPAQLAPQALPVLMDALRDPSEEVWQVALWAVRDNVAYQAPEVLRLIESLAADGTPERQQREARRLLAELQKR